MKQRMQGMVIGFLVSVLFLSGITVWAATGTQNITVTYRDIKLFIDGTQITPRDANGNVVEPFIYNGTTYLPVRAVGEAFGKEVEWDGENATVYVGQRGQSGQSAPQNQPAQNQVTYLSDLQYTDFLKGNRNNQVHKINGSVTDFDGQQYSSGMVFYLENAYGFTVIEYDKDGAHASIDYPVNSAYRQLTGKIVLPQKINTTTMNYNSVNSSSGINVDILFYGDDKLIQRVNNVTTSMPFDFDINLAGVNKLTIKIVSGYTYSHYVALTDLVLSK